MALFLNNLSSASNLLTFTDVPTLLTVTGGGGGARATFTFAFQGNLQSSVTANSQYYVTFLGETVTNVISPNDANNKRFYIASDATSTAASFANALRCCASLAANFIITHQGDSVVLTAKTVGIKFDYPDYISRNIPNGNLSTNGSDGSTAGLTDSIINVDVYASNTYLTTLTKNYYGDKCEFDVSPILSTVAQYGTTVPYRLSVSSLQGGVYSSIGTMSGRTTVGYHINNSDKYKVMSSTPEILVNDNNYGNKLYTYSNVIPFSVICTSSSASYRVRALDSTYSTIYSANSSVSSISYLKDTSITIPSTAFSSTYYVDITMGNKTTRFEVIKPLKASPKYRRVYWRNEYGGLQFFDFVGDQTYTEGIDTDIYNKNIYDYFSNADYEEKKIYNSDYTREDKLTSHLMSEGGRYALSSLLKSKSVWYVTDGDGTRKYIIPKSLEFTKNNASDNVYTATFTYTYSYI